MPLWCNGSTALLHGVRDSSILSRGTINQSDLLNGEVVELVDTLGLSLSGHCARVGSSPTFPTCDVDKSLKSPPLKGAGFESPLEVGVLPSLHIAGSRSGISLVS